MRTSRIRTAFVAAVVTLGCASAAVAGPYADDLSKCLVSSTTGEDKSKLVKWIFSVATLHPAVSSVAAVTDEQRTELSKSTAALFESLLTERCRTQTQEALRYEGPSTIQTAFGVLGQAAMMELFSDPAVAKGLGDLSNHVNSQKLEQVLGKTP